MLGRIRMLVRRVGAPATRQPVSVRWPDHPPRLARTIRHNCSRCDNAAYRTGHSLADWSRHGRRPCIAARPARAPTVSDPGSDAAAYACQSLSPATLRAYRADWDDFCQWCQGQRLPLLPAAPATVAGYLASLAASHGRADALVTYNLAHFRTAAARFGLRLARPVEILREAIEP
jgi:hypothetical protein